MDVLFADPGVKRIESSGVSMPNDEPALRVEHLSFSYPDDVETRVLDDISFTVPVRRSSRDFWCCWCR